MSGRPTKINEDFISLIDEYLESTGDETIKLQKGYSESSKGSSESFEYKLKTKLPSVIGLVNYYQSKGLSINKDTLYSWKIKGETEENCDEIFVRFSDTFKKVIQKQEEMLLNGAISGSYNPIISKMLLNVNHGYKEVEKREVEHSGQIKNPSGVFSALTGFRDKVVGK